MGYLYLGLAFLGAVAPYSYLGQFLIANGLNLAEFKAQLTSTPVGSYFGLNMLVAALVTALFILGEGKRLKMRGLWLPLLTTVAVGVSCGLPLFLYLRRLSLERPVGAGDPQAVHDKSLK
jgi:hypothetical protein